MPSSNVELVQRMLGAYLSGDEDALEAIIDPTAEVYGAPGLINSGDSTFGWLFEFRDGRAVRFHAYVSREEALDSAKTLAGSK